MADNFGEIPVKFVFVKVGRYLQSKWIIILLAGLIGGLLAFLYANSKKPKYTATLTFVLSSESKGGGFSGLASQLGFDVGGGGSNDLFAGDNILTLFKSRNMIKRALFKTPDREKDLLINHFVRNIKLDKSWEKNERTKNAFPFPAGNKPLTGIQDSLLRDIHALIVEKYLKVAHPDKKLSYYSISSSSTNETISFYLTRFLMDETAKFYIETKTRLAKQNLEMVQHEADSLRGLLGHTITATASSVDQTFNLNPALQIKRAPIQRGQVNTTFLASAYGEVSKNVIVAKMNLQKEMPLYQIIDEPTLPLRMEVVNTKLYVFAGALALVFLVSFILILMFFFRKND